MLSSGRWLCFGNPVRARYYSSIRTTYSLHYTKHWVINLEYRRGMAHHKGSKGKSSKALSACLLRNQFLFLRFQVEEAFQLLPIPYNIRTAAPEFSLTRFCRSDSHTWIKFLCWKTSPRNEATARYVVLHRKQGPSKSWVRAAFDTSTNLRRYTSSNVGITPRGYTLKMRVVFPTACILPQHPGRVRTILEWQWIARAPILQNNRSLCFQ